MRLGFGGFQLPMLNKKCAIRLVKEAYNQGIRFFETARDYRNSEEIIGTALEDVREGVILATKMGDNLNIDKLDSSFHASLRKLRTSHIDIYTMQGINTRTKYNRYMEEVLPKLQEYQENAEIRFIGLSTHDLDIAEHSIREGVADVLFTPMNIIQREAISRLIPLIRSSHMKLVALKPFGGYKYHWVQGQDVKWISDTREFDGWFKPQYALNYLLQFPEISCILCGFSHIYELNLDISAIQYKLSEKEKEMLSFEKFPELYQELDFLSKNINCPEGIRLPVIARLWTYYKFYGIRRWCREFYNHLDMDYRDCTGCGKCQHGNVYIRDMLQQLHEELYDV